MSDDSEADESRTLSVGVKRSMVASEGQSSGNTTPSKRSRKGRVKPPDYRDFVPNGTAFSGTKKQLHTQTEIPREVDSLLPSSRASNMPTGGGWNPGATGPIRTTLRGSDRELGKNRLATGFPKQKSRQTKENGLTRTSSLAQSSTGESQDDAIEISDDTDMESDSEGGMMINVDAQETRPASRRILVSDDEMEDGEMLSSGQNTASQISSPTSFQNSDDAHQQLQDDLRRTSISNSTPMGVPTSGLSGPRLADLNPDELEKQIKYTLFHLSRDQIDLNRLAVCTACLQEGHLEESCPERHCTHCETQGEHSSRMCPQFRRCTKCRERGHDVSVCTSKLRDISVPCDYCGSSRHLEDTCSMRFFPVPACDKKSQIKLWVSCCSCASNTHLVGDCPAIDPDQASRWTLRSLDPHQIINVSLESGTGKQIRDAMNRGMRPEGLRIKGRAELHRAGEPQNGEMSQFDDEPFLRPPVGRTRPPLGSGQMQSGRGNDGRRRIQIEPVLRDERRYDPPSGSRNRNGWYATDSFGNSRRSRSPEPDRYRNAYRPSQRRESPPRYQNMTSGDHWTPAAHDQFREPVPREQFDNYRPEYRLPHRPDTSLPPLPREPPPNRPPSPYDGRRVQLPTRQGTNEWLGRQGNESTVMAADFRPRPQQGLQHHQQRGVKNSGARGGKGKNKQKNNGSNGGGGQSKKNKKSKA